MGFNYNGTQYFYLKNAQGDVAGITDVSGNIIAEYVYDSWGKVLHVLDASGTEITDQSNIAQINPLRYRGYYYDSELGLYYLNARYYDSETGRFVNADYESNLLGENKEIPGCNLFAYCKNNPIQFVDPTGLSGVLQIFAHEYHAWIAYTNDQTGITQTIGTWGGDLSRRHGINYNEEAKGIANRGWYYGRVSLSANIDDDQEKDLFDFIANHDKWELFYNCSSFAVGAWEAAGQKAISNKALGIVPSPAALARNIKTVEGYQINAPTIPRIIKKPQKANISSNPLSIPYDSSYLLALQYPDKSGSLNYFERSILKFI